MPFIPHTSEEIQTMLESIGVKNVSDLLDEIPKKLLIENELAIPEGLMEMALKREMRERSKQDEVELNFMGAGAYEHHIPSAVWSIASRGEWRTSYTPYQAEASQGTLQLLYEYQTMMAGLMAMEVSNASLYDGASGLAEAILMAVRLQAKQNKTSIILPRTVHPLYRQVVQTIVSAQGIKIIDLPYQKETGRIDTEQLEQLDLTSVAAIVIPQPNYFGILEAVHELTDWAKSKQILVIGLVNPLSMALLSPPGEWGKMGADIGCGEGQPLGIPLASGGPYFGFLCCKKEFIRQLPGRLVGRTTDSDNKEGFALTLQAREQHIRRAKATSNICTNQGLLVTAATLYMSLLGESGLSRVAKACYANTEKLVKKLQTLEGVEIVFPTSPVFHECVLKFSTPIETVIKTLSKQGIQPGVSLKSDYPELGESLLICATETKTEADLNRFVQALSVAVKEKATTC